MSRKPKKGYFVRGQFVAEGSELDLELKRELKGTDAASKTDLKRESAELQELGEALLTLRAGLFDKLDLGEKLTRRDRRSQAHHQFRGQAPPDAVHRQADARARCGHAATPCATRSTSRTAARPQETAALHEAERWRDRLIADDDALGGWIETHPGTDAQQLRALIRQARKDIKAGPPGEAPRQAKAYREIFQLVRAQLGVHGSDDHAAEAAEQSREEDA